MRTASMVMGIVGGSIAILFFIILLLTSSPFLDLQNYNTDLEQSAYNRATASTAAMFSALALCMVIAGVLGLIGGIIVKKKNVAAGVLMIISAVLGFFNTISMVLFILGGVFALIRDRSQMYALPPYPYPQSPYPPQPATPEQNRPEQQ